MKGLKNWDNKTWLSSINYISAFIAFLKSKIKIDNNTKILDIGCGRANIISALQVKYDFKNKPIGIDIVKNENIKRNIIFKKIDGINYLKKNKNNFDLIIVKQTVHLISQNKINIFLNLLKKRLNKKGKLLIFSLNTKNNRIPCFKLMKKKLIMSLRKDELIFKKIKKNLIKTKECYFKYKVTISKQKYVKMIKLRYISCLLNISNKDLKKGIKEIRSNYKNEINFIDILKCISFSK